MKTRIIQKHLRSCSKDELIEMFLELAKDNAAAERFLNSKVGIITSDHNFDEYKAYVRSEFFPDGDHGGGNPSIAYQMVQKVEAEATSSNQVINFIYFCVEAGVEYTLAYGDIDEKFYMAFEDLFERAAKLASKNRLQDNYFAQAKNIVRSTSEMGWGFHDELSRIFKKYFISAKYS